MIESINVMVEVYLKYGIIILFLMFIIDDIDIIE